MGINRKELNYCWGAGYFYYDTIPDLAKNLLPPLEPILLILSDRIGKALKILYSAYQFSGTGY
jgi:hypothetical protein